MNHLRRRAKAKSSNPPNRGEVYESEATSQGVRFSEKTSSSVDRGARYKVYAHTNTSQLLTCMLALAHMYMYMHMYMHVVVQLLCSVPFCFERQG